jgi:hypothetical protein
MGALAYSIPFPTTKLPSEIAAVNHHRLVEIYLAGYEAAERSLHSVEDAIEALNTSFVRLCDDKRWDSKKGPLKRWFLLLVQNECKALRKRRRPERLASYECLAKRYYQETYDGVVTSPEDLYIAAEGEDRDEQELAELRAVWRDVYKRIAHNEDAVALFRFWATSDERLSLTEIATKLGISTARVYAAKKVIEHHTKNAF